MYTFNKHVRWRKDNNEIFICDCKRLIDFKVPFEFEEELVQLSEGVNELDLNPKSKKLFLDFKKMKLLSSLKIRQIDKNEFYQAMSILDNELKRVRDNKFLLEKFKKYPEFFIGVFLENELMGLICGFPREDYLLISEIAIDSKFQNRGFGNRLVKKFEEVAKEKGYKKINAGAQDNAVMFYQKLNYAPFLLIQCKESDYTNKNFKDMKIKRNVKNKDYRILEADITSADLNLLNNLRKKYPKVHFQYIFTKKL